MLAMCRSDRHLVSLYIQDIIEGHQICLMHHHVALNEMLFLLSPLSYSSFFFLLSLRSNQT